jgi:hypothetical protein
MFLLAGFWEAFILLFIFIPLILLWAYTLSDLFVRQDLQGWKKVMWLLVIIMIPLIGPLAYMVVRPADPPMDFPHV